MVDGAIWDAAGRSYMAIPPVILLAPVGIFFGRYRTRDARGEQECPPPRIFEKLAISPVLVGFFFKFGLPPPGMAWPLP